MVSVCMITYNHENFIREAIEGVIMQKTNFPIKLILGEDCSTDNTRKICEEYQQSYPDIIELLPTLTNLGMIPNFIRTLKACAGKYIALCEGDDYWTDPLKLQKQVDFLEVNEEISGCFHDSIVINDKGELIKKTIFSFKQYKFNQKECLTILRHQYHTGSLVFRNKSINEFLTLIPNNAICDFTMDLVVTENGLIQFIPLNMSAYRIHSGGVWQGNKPYKNLINHIKRLSLLRRTRLFHKYKNDFSKQIESISLSNIEKNYLDFRISELLKSIIVYFQASILLKKIPKLTVLKYVIKKIYTLYNRKNYYS